MKYATTIRNLTLIFTFLFIGWSVSASVNSEAAATNNSYNNSFIFVEGGVEFSVYPNGEFDFYYNPAFRRGNSGRISTPNGNISYNSGYNYEPYIQYDDYGAVIQIENIPVYYDYYGRIIQAGNIFLSYNNFGRLGRVGDLYVHYNRHHHITHNTGFINSYNRRYVYRPWHDYYRRPNVNVRVVYGRPYRAYYEPQRLSYNNYVTVYNNYYTKNPRKRNFYRPSQKVRSYNYGRRTANMRALVNTRSRFSNNYTATRKSTPKSRSYSSNHRRENVKTNQRVRRSYIDRNRSIDYSDRQKRSTTARGRSFKATNTQNNSQANSGERSIRRSQSASSNRIDTRSTERVSKPRLKNRESSVENRNNTRMRNYSPATGSRSFEKNTRSSERKSRAQRPISRRSTSKLRKNSGSVRSRS